MTKQNQNNALDKLHLHQLPKTWKWITIQDIATSEKNAIVDGPFGSNLKLSDYIDPPGVPVLSTANIRHGYSPERVRYISFNKFEQLKRSEVRGGDILVAKIGSCGLTGIYTDGMPSAIIPANLLKITVDQSLSRAYVFYYLNSHVFTSFLQTIIKSTAQPAFNISKFKVLPFPLAPRPDQDYIVSEIEKQFTRLEAGVSALKRIQANLKRYRASVLKAACEGNLVPTEAELARQEGRSYEPADVLLQHILKERRSLHERQCKKRRKKYIEPELPNEVHLSPLPEGWCWTSPEQLSSAEEYSLAIGPFGSNLKVSDYKSKGVPLVFVRNIRSRLFNNESTKYISIDKASELRPHRLCGGDILITKMGDPPGDACLYPEGNPLSVITADCIKLTLSTSLSEKLYFVHAINSEVVKSQIQAITKGVAQMKVSLGRFSSIAIPLPPLAEQQRIVSDVERRLSVIDELEAVVAANLKRSERLRQAILHKAFTGQLV